MANKSQQLVYWDSDVFLSWLNEHPERAPIIKGMYESIVKRKGKIVTSAFTIAEVAHIETEKRRQKRFETVDEDIKAMWQDTNILVVEAPRLIMEMARDLMRANLEYGGGLKAGDAIHLATAKFMENNGLFIQEVNSYNGWEKYAPLIGMTICEPHYEPEDVQLTMDSIEGFEVTDMDEDFEE